MLTLAHELRQQYQITLVCPPTPGGRSLLDRASATGIATLAIEARDDPAAIAALQDWLRMQRIDIFHCHAGIGWEGFGGINAARDADVPVVVRTEHLPYLITHPIQRADHQRAIQLIDRLICVSEEVRASMLKAGVPAAKVSVIHNGILAPQAERDAASVRAELGLPDDARMILTVARMTEQKAHHTLLDAISAIAPDQPGAHFVWVGDGPLELELRAEVHERGLDRHIHMIGRRGDVPDLMASSELFVLPSLFEGFPLVVLEAMALGLPVLGTRVCGTSEAVIEGETGRLVAPGDAAALAAALLEALERPEQTAGWGQAGRRLVQRKFSAAHMGHKTAAIYQELHSSRKQCAADAGLIAHEVGQG
jgi:glycosyltransferase involved in cell wall biosynthesis